MEIGKCTDRRKGLGKSYPWAVAILSVVTSHSFCWRESLSGCFSRLFFTSILISSSLTQDCLRDVRDQTDLIMLTSSADSDAIIQPMISLLIWRIEYIYYKLITFFLLFSPFFKFPWLLLKLYPFFPAVKFFLCYCVKLVISIADFIFCDSNLICYSTSRFNLFTSVTYYAGVVKKKKPSSLMRALSQIPSVQMVPATRPGKWRASLISCWFVYSGP